MGAFKRRDTDGGQPHVPESATPRPRKRTPAAPRASRRGNRPAERRLQTVPAAPRRQPSPAPGTSPARQLPFSAHRSLTASASIVDVSTAEQRTKFAKRRASAQGWQEEAWAYFDAVGEVKYAFGLVGNTISRVRLYAGVVEDPSVPPVQADTKERAGAVAHNALSRLDSAFGGVPGLLRDAAMNLQISGECNLVQVPSDPFRKTPESWDIRSTDELQLSPDGQMMIVPTADGDKSSATLLPKNAFVARIWRPHPRYSDEPDSSMRGLLDACAELLLLNKTFRATARSRLNSGLLYLPDGLSVAASQDPDAEPLDPEDPRLDPDSEAYDPGLDPSSTEGGVGVSVLQDPGDAADTDEFEEALLEAMTAPIADEESASAVVPLLVRGPAELGEKIRLIQFERSFDPALAERADKVLDRIMQGLDVPKDIVQGLANIKYSNAVVIDQSLYTSHIEPLALLICDALTNVYLRPSLRAAGIPEEEVKKYVVWYDASDVTTRPNRADDATEGYGLHAISAETWRRTHNFTEDDAPAPEEIALRMLIDKGSITPELAEALLTVVAPDVMKAVREASQAGSPAPLPPEVAQALGSPAPEAGGGGDEQAPPAAPGEAPPAAPANPPTTPEPGLPFEEPETLRPEDLQ